MPPLTGQDYYNMMSSLINGFNMDQTLFLQMLNTARVSRESMRPFMRFRKFISIATANPGDTFQSAKPLPDDFIMLTKDGYIVLFDNIQTWQEYLEIPQYLSIQYKDENNQFFIDHAGGNLYLCGIVDRTYSIFLPYQADLGDITLTTQWLNVPNRYHAMLAYDVAAMYRLGVDYDDINARNADENGRMAEMLFASMTKWDGALQRSSTTEMDYPRIGESADFISHKINING